MTFGSSKFCPATTGLAAEAVDLRLDGNGIQGPEPVENAVQLVIFALKLFRALVSSEEGNLLRRLAGGRYWNAFGANGGGQAHWVRPVATVRVAH